MANEQNLIPFGDRTESEQRDIRSKGGKASGVARRKRKLFRERLREALDCKVTSEEFKEQLESLGMNSEDATNEDLLASSLLVSAIVKNDTSAAEMILSYIGESPKEKRNASRAKAQNALDKAKTDALKRYDDNNIERESSGFLEALDGKIDNSDWDETEN